MSKKLEFEDSIRRLQEIIDDLESGDTPLKDTVSLYEEGVDLLQSCVSELKQSELKISELRKKSEGVFELLDTDE